MLATVPILLGWLLTIGACYAAGTILLAQLKLVLYREEEYFFRFVAGAGCFSLLIFLLTAAQLAYTPVFVLSELLLIGLGSWRMSAQKSSAVPLPDFPYLWKAIFWLPITVFGIYYFVHALSPEMSPDGATYHLGIVGRYFRQHSFGHITLDMYANLSEAIEMLFLSAYSVGKHSAAALVEFTFLLALPFGMLSYGRRIGYAQAGVFGALLVYASPVFGISGTIAYNDAAGACVLFAMFYALQIWVESRENKLIPLIGLLAGFCFGAKYTLFLALPFAGLFLMWKMWRAKQNFVRPLILFTATSLLLVAPWLIKNWVTVQNPFSPFANQLFRNPYITIQFEREYSDLMKHREGLTLAQRPLDHIVTGAKTAGLLGPVFLLAPLALLALRFPAGRQLLLAAGVFILPAYANVETRFLMAMAPFLSLALALALFETRVGIPVVLAFHLLASWPALVRAYASPYAWHLHSFHPAEAFRLVPETQTLRTRMPEFKVAELLEQKTPANARIFTYSNPPEAYTSREIIVKYESALGNLLGEMIWTALNPEFQPKRELKFAFPAQDLQKIRVVQTGTNPESVWSISELRVLNGSGEVFPDEKWKMAASVNPWDLPLAFDNRLVSRWSTVEPIRPGMYVEVDLGQRRQVSSVVLNSAVEWFARLQLQAEVEGKWIVIVAQPEILDRAPALELRHETTLELRRNGVTHLLIAPDDFRQDDFFQNQPIWGIQLIGEAQGNRLYKLL